MIEKKILWFTNTPSLLSEKYSGKSVAGGWIPSLEKIFREKGYNLRVAFHDNVIEVEKDIYNGNTYYKIPAFAFNTKIHRYLRKCFSRIENEKFLIKQYKKVIEDYNPDIVQIWGSEGPFGLIIPYLDVPHILHFQGNLNAIYNKYFIAFSKRQLRRSVGITDLLKVDPFYFSSGNLKKKAKRERKIFCSCQNFFGRTNFDRRVIKALSNNATYYHCDEIMRDEFYNSIWRKPDNNVEKFKLISVYRDSIYKGLETIYDCANLLKNKGFHFEWNVVGVLENSPTKKLIKKYRNYLLDNLNVNFLGFQPASNLKSLLLQSDLMVHTTHTENGCNSVSEAMLLGIPVLSTSAGGLQTTINDDISGFLVQDGDYFALAGAIIEIKENYPKSIEIGLNGRTIAQKRHDKNLIFNKVIGTYKELIQQHKN